MRRRNVFFNSLLQRFFVIFASHVQNHQTSASGGHQENRRALPENVNYAVKSPDVSGLSFLESVPAVSTKLKEPITADRMFEDVVKSAQDAAVLVLVY